MFFSIQGVMGLKSLQVDSDADAEMNLETKNNFLQQENTSGKKPFLNLLDQATEKRKIYRLPANGQARQPAHEDQKRISSPNLSHPKFHLENKEHSTEIPLEKPVLEDVEAVIHLMCDEKGTGLNPELLYVMEASGSATEESTEALLFGRYPNLVAKNDEVDVDEENGIDYFRSGSESLPGLQTPKSADLTDNGFSVTGSPQVSEAMKSVLVNMLMTNRTGMTSNGSEMPGIIDQILKPLTSNHNHAAWEHSLLYETTGNVHEGRADINSQYDKIIGDMPSKSVVNFPAEKSQNRQDGTGEMVESAMKRFSAFNGDLGNHVTTLDIEKHAAMISDKGVDRSFQSLKDNGFPYASNMLQHLPVADAQNQTSSLNFHIRQAAMTFTDVLQGFENTIVHQVVARLFSGFRHGPGNWMINLHPPELGRVKVRIISGNGTLNVHLQAQSHQVAGVLEKNLPTLKHSLEDQGIVFSDLQVSVESGNQERAPFEEHTFYFTGRELSSLEPSEDDQDNVLLESNVGWPGSLQGLNLRV